MWSALCGRTFIRENSLHPEKANHIGILDLLRETNLSKTVLNVPTFVKQMVLEFYCNLSVDISVKSSPHYHRTFIRGMLIDFSPDVINNFLGFVLYHGVNMDGGMNVVVSELTGVILGLGHYLG